MTNEKATKQQSPIKSEGPPQFQFENLRISTLDCQSLDAKSIFEYCENSRCDIIALQESDDLGEDPRIVKYHQAMVFFIKDSSIDISTFEWEADHPGIGILRFLYKDVEFTLVNIVSDHVHLQKCLEPIKHEEDQRIMIICSSFIEDFYPVFLGNSRSQKPGFRKSERTDILQDISNFGDKMIGSLWRVSKNYEEYRKTASKEDLMKCKVFEPLHILADARGHKTVEELVLDRLNRLFSNPNFKLEPLDASSTGSHRVTLDEVRKHFPKTTEEANIKSACKLFNEALSGINIPSKWRDIHFKLPNQSVFPQKIEYYDNFPWKIVAHREICSNILAQKSNFDMDPRRKIEKILILVLLLQKFKKPIKPIYLLFINFKNPYDSVKISSILSCLKTSNAPPQLYYSFASLLTDNRALLETRKGDMKSDKKKLRGIHLGHLANSFLLGNVIKSIQDAWDSLDVSGIEIGADESLKSIQFEDHLVLIDEKISNFEDHLGNLFKISTSYGLVIDGLTLMKNSTGIGENEFTFQNTQVKTTRRAVSILGQTISVKGALKYEIERRVTQAKELINITPSLGSMNVISKLMFFKSTIVPKFFYACETWTPTGKEIRKISDRLKKLSEELEIPYHFDVYRKILSEKARFIKWIAMKPNSFCHKLLNEASGNRQGKKNSEWSFELVKNFKLFDGKNGENLLSIAATDSELWESFITYCETKAKRSLNWKQPIRSE